MSEFLKHGVGLELEYVVYRQCINRACERREDYQRELNRTNDWAKLDIAMRAYVEAAIGLANFMIAHKDVTEVTFTGHAERTSPADDLAHE